MRTVAVLSAVLVALAVAVPPHGSHDLWSYAMYGRMVAHYHASPYRHVPREYPGDPIGGRVTWTHTPSVYGPVFTALSAVLMAVAGGSTLLARLAFQGAAAAALVAGGVLLWRRGTAPAGVALLVLNPVVMIAIVNGGHNDLLVGGLLLAAASQLQERRPVRAGALLAAAALIKASALLAVVAALAWAWRRWEPRAVAVMGGTIAAAVGAAYVLAGGLVAVTPLLSAAGRDSHASVWRLVADTWPRLPIGPASVVIGGVVMLAVGRRWRLDASPALVMGAVLLAYLLMAPYVMPWYVGWALPLLARRWDSALARVAVAYSCLLFVAYAFGSTRGVLALPVTPLFALAAIAMLAGAGWRGRPSFLSHPAATMGACTTTSLPR